ncbi:MAG: GTPase Era [Gammaproteobacteria bacterium CG_4_10_14_0_8_um_filter_38_16]|nr:MAG: GTPase Era [Gammaproteobacteria bacterium CG_4_10_14_0_8_um_filter_38_16]PJA03356.1 MAG: GTPase Era [Gammaproteobacteria bacterium CG_4_10_14_0_2_um_filter_38_22]PJB10670.1 MAG: GTPase Era [Gammaproteobacteria bacterium CG_4_9_14_3_um_filter_38_9]
MSDNAIKHSGMVAIVGKPNVGKSTLMNYILGKKISITSRKPQTTRHRILGIKTTDVAQTVYVDTPGLHTTYKREMNRVMNRVTKSVFDEVDVVLFLIEAMRWDKEDANVLLQLKAVEKPVILVINKIDDIKNKLEMLPFIENLAKQLAFAKIVPISAKTGLQVDELQKTIETLLPHEGELFPTDQLTDRTDRFVAAEFVREKLMRGLGDELPYECAVTIDAFEEDDRVIRIAALIWVGREGQKAIVIGKNGAGLRAIGTQARIDLENYFEKKVFLKLWVKVKENWSDDQRSLKVFGYQEE